MVAFRWHLPSKILDHNALPDNFRRGNILVWEQSLAERRRGVPLALEAHDADTVHSHPDPVVVRSHLRGRRDPVWVGDRVCTRRDRACRLRCGAQGQARSLAVWFVKTTSMALDQFGAKPAVLRCTRCGRFVDWDEAHVQVVCNCKPHLDLPPVLVRRSDGGGPRGRACAVRPGLRAHQIVAFGEVMDIDRMPALVAIMRDEPAGALAYRLLPDALHIVALATDPMWQRSGVGGYLVAEAELLARRLNLDRLIMSTTNDNLPALYFYQRRGYRLTHLVPDSVLLHTHQVVAGFAGIPTCDEIRLEKRIR